MGEPSSGHEDDSTYSVVAGMLEEITEEWDAGPITADTCLGSLGLESINLVYFIAELQQQFDLQDRLFKKLIADNMNITNLQVGDVVRFIQELKNDADPSSNATDVVDYR